MGLRVRKPIIWLAVLVVAGAVAAIGTKALVLEISGRKAARVLAAQAGATQTETVINLARWAANVYADRDDEAWYFRYFYLFYNRRLPDLFRFPRGSLELLALSRNCNSVASLLEFVFAHDNLPARQHDIVQPRGSGHAALSVLVAGKWRYIDPYLGVVFVEDGQILALDELQQQVAAGRSAADLAVPLRATDTRIDYYDRIDEAFHALIGDPMLVEVKMALADGGIQVGQPDGKYWDTDGAPLGMTSHVHYLGPRYSRAWRRRFTADDAPGGFSISFHLTEPPQPSRLPRSNIPPIIDGNVVTYVVHDRDEGLLLDGSAVPFDIRRWKNWYDVDYLTAEAL
ncbi:MAG: hypothetical protein ACTSX7_19890 [Alphaproteobacteria bacterium]